MARSLGLVAAFIALLSLLALLLPSGSSVSHTGSTGERGRLGALIQWTSRKAANKVSSLRALPPSPSSFQTVVEIHGHNDSHHERRYKGTAAASETTPLLRRGKDQRIHETGIDEGLVNKQSTQDRSIDEGWKRKGREKASRGGKRNDQSKKRGQLTAPMEWDYNLDRGGPVAGVASGVGEEAVSSMRRRASRGSGGVDESPGRAVYRGAGTGLASVGTRWTQPLDEKRLGITSFSPLVSDVLSRGAEAERPDGVLSAGGDQHWMGSA